MMETFSCRRDVSIHVKTGSFGIVTFKREYRKKNYGTMEGDLSHSPGFISHNSYVSGMK
jgi:hypothetical protein